VDRIFRSFVLGGRRMHLVEDAEVRAEDLRTGSATVHLEDEGCDQVVLVDQFRMSVPAGHPVIPDEDKYELRPLIEKVLDLGFDDDWITEITESARRHDMFRSPE